ncbi:MAG: beta-lactamase family protein [Deltaproteobacteria bacterium]|nr:beta-lactamase family protein [Deltaproteobacteria bacterium]
MANLRKLGTLSAVILAALTLAACGSEESGPSSSSTSSGSGGAGGGGGAGGDESCALLAGQLQAALDQSLAVEARAGGTAAAVITPDCGLWEGTAGEANAGVPLEPTHLLRIGSVTKTYVAATVLKLVAGGSLSLDDTLDNWVTGVPNGDTITVRQLLNHTAGVYSYTEDTAYMNGVAANPDTPVEPQDMVDVAINHGADFPPGTSWSYSNTGYILLGMIIEAVVAGSVGPEIRSQVLDPQGLEATFLDGEEPLGGELAHGFDAIGIDATNTLHPSVPWTAGSMVATAGDAARWMTALYGGDVLEPAEQSAMLEAEDLGSGMEYGLGTFILSPPASPWPAQGHTGGIPGFLTNAFYFPDHDTAIATVVNSQAGDPAAALAALAMQVLPLPRRIIPARPPAAR